MTSLEARNVTRIIRLPSLGNKLYGDGSLNMVLGLKERNGFQMKKLELPYTNSTGKCFVFLK